jgi:hypothetical protein
LIRDPKYVSPFICELTFDGSILGTVSNYFGIIDYFFLALGQSG